MEKNKILQHLWSKTDEKSLAFLQKGNVIIKHSSTFFELSFEVNHSLTKRLFTKASTTKYKPPAESKGCVANSKIALFLQKITKVRKPCDYSLFWASRRVPYHNLNVFRRLKFRVLLCILECHDNTPWACVIPCHVRRTLPEIRQLPQASSGVVSGEGQGSELDIVSANALEL